MPAPRRPAEELPQAPAGATTAAAATPYVAGAVTPAAAATVAVAGLGAGTALTVGGLIEALERFSRLRFASAETYVYEELRREYPTRPDAELRKLVEQESEFETEFRRKMRERLRADLPKAFAISDPSVRLDEIRKIFEREKRFTLMREEAMLLRALGRADALLLRDLSPEGAYWKLSPVVREHTLDCLAMGEKFWPWSVLDRFQPPVHYGCQCYLLGLEEAIREGYMEADQVPDAKEAEARAKKLLKDAHDAMGELPEDEIQDWINEALDRLAEAEGLPPSNVVDISEARRGKRDPKRFAKGLVKGGQFMPERGGVSARTRRTLRDLVNPMSPARGRARKRGSWQWVDGRYTRIPTDEMWQRRIGGKLYSSPAGSSTVFRDGEAVSTVRPRALRSPGVNAPPPVAGDIVEQLRAKLRSSETEDMKRLVAARRSPLRPGDSASRLLTLQDAGFTLESTQPHPQGTKLRYRNGPGATVDVVFDGKGIAAVDFNPAPQVRLPRGELRRPPGSWNEHQRDALSWADELGDRFDADVQVPEVRVDRRLQDHAGTHQWSGEADLGAETPRDIERAARARAAGRDLRDDEARGVWSSYWVTAHEISHGVNPIRPELFQGGHANLEEALAEEVSHQLAVERLEEQGQTDVLDWRARNPKHAAVVGNYLHERAALSEILDLAGIRDAGERRSAIMELKFAVPPEQRFERLAELVKAAHPDESMDDIVESVELAMEHRSPRDHGALPFSTRSPGREAARGQYGAFQDAWMSGDGRTLFTPQGGVRRIERLPVPPWLPEHTDGSAIVTYPPGEPYTDDLSYADGVPKKLRFVDSEARAKLILRAYLGKGSQGTTGQDYADAVERLKRLRPDGYEWIDGMPVKALPGGGFQVGFEEGPKIDSAERAVQLATRERRAAPASPGATPPASPGIPESAKKLFDAFFGGKADEHKPDDEDDAIIRDAIVASEAPKKKPKGPTDPLIGKVIGGIGTGDETPGPIPNYDDAKLTLGKSAGGSNGARWAFDEDGNRWLLKTYKGNVDRIATETLANAVYREIGAKVADAGTITYPTGQPDFGALHVPAVKKPPLPDTSKRISTGMIVFDDDGDIWIYEPKNHFGGYKRTFPKGGLEPNLTQEQNAAKEVWEETGLHAVPMAFLGDFEGDTSVSRYFIARRTGGAPTTGKETASVEKVTIAEARELLNKDRDQEILDALEAHLANGPMPGDPTPEMIAASDVTSLPEVTQVALTYPTLDGDVHEHFKPSEALGEHFVADALLANWDFVGMTGDNVLWDADGQPIRIDQGGTFELRAQGQAKPYGPVPTELWTMLTKGQGKRGVKVTEEQLKAQSADVEQRLTPDVVDNLVDAAPFQDDAMRERIRENLKARIAWMGAYARGEVDVPKPAEGNDARAALESKVVDPFPEQEDALFGYVEGMADDVNKVLRDKSASLKDASKPVQRTVNELDGLLRASKTPEDVIVWAGINGDPEAAGKLDGKTLSEKGYLHAGFDPDDVDAPVRLRLTLPAGSLAVYTQGFGYEDMPASPEVIIARDAKLQVTGVTVGPDGSTVLAATVATKPSYKPAPKSQSDSSSGSWKKPGSDYLKNLPPSKIKPPPPTGDLGIGYQEWLAQGNKGSPSDFLDATGQ